MLGGSIAREFLYHSLISRTFDIQAQPKQKKIIIYQNTSKLQTA